MDNIAFEIGGFAIHWYGILVAAGFLIGLWTAARRGLRDGLPPEKVADLGPWLIIGTLVGARLLYVISNWGNYFSRKPFWEIFMIRHGGLVFYGGLIGATLAGLFYVRLKKLPFWKMADALAPSIALGYVIGRFGCLMNGCCYGMVTDLPWAIHFPEGHETYPAGVHPTQIYESLVNLGLYGALAWAYRRKKFDGQIFALYLVGYAVLRSFVEMFRGDYQTYYFGHSTPAQLLSAGIFLSGVFLWWRLSGAAPRPLARVSKSG